jgi:N-glycosidase YbiA
MTCTFNGCHNQALTQYQNFCSRDHLKKFAWRKVPPHITNTTKGARVFFYDRRTHEQNYEFSNFFPKGVDYQNNSFKTAEHAFQATKFAYTAQDPQLNQKVQDVFNKILNADTPKQASEIAQNNQTLVRGDWHQKGASGFTKKEEVMLAIVKDKFTRHPNLREKLLKTGSVKIVEDSPKDSFWGRGADHKGENKLGRILMKIRSDMQKGLY